MTTTQFSSEARSQYKAKAYAAASAKSPLAPMTIARRDPGEHDIQIEILCIARIGFVLSKSLIARPCTVKVSHMPLFSFDQIG